jgi:putative GTP pyrophosphokinase
VNESELKAEYERRKPVLQAWGSMVVRHIEEELQKRISKPVSEFLKLYPVVPRVKRTDSFLTKALDRKKYQDPLKDTTDLVGVRFVVLLRSEILILCDIIERSTMWEDIKAKDFRDEIEAEPHHFDYQSDHYVVRASKPYPSEGGVEIPFGLPCEVQVRTLLQHAYAELAHDRTYKSPAAIVTDVRREVAKSAALVETTDEIFQDVDERLEEAIQGLRDLHAHAVAEYKKCVAVTYVDNFQFSRKVLLPYTETLSEFEISALSQFLQNKDYIGTKVAERAQLHVFYSHPVVLWVYFLVYHKPFSVTGSWPIDRTYLANIYADLGKPLED